jgi:hypothetical protein
MTDTNDAGRIKAARRALMAINALDVRRKDPRAWNAACEAALRDAEAVVSSTPPRLLLQVYRDMREGPRAHSPVEPVMRTTNEESRRPRHGEDGVYDRSDMRARRF